MGKDVCHRGGKFIYVVGPITEVSRTCLPTSRHKRHAAWRRHPKQKKNVPVTIVYNAVKDWKVGKYICVWDQCGYARFSRCKTGLMLQKWSIFMSEWYRF